MYLKQFEFIDALRGWAILGVVLVHASQWTVPASSLFDTVAKQGARGVQLFFIISAFTLFLSMEKRSIQESHCWKKYFIRRFFRIAPLFYLALIAYTLINGFGSRYFAPDGIAWWFFPLTISFLNGWQPQTINSVVPGGWSIAVEAMFYVTLPLLFAKIKSIKVSLFFLSGALLLAQLLNMAVTHYLEGYYPAEQDYLVAMFTSFWFFAQLPIFALGMLTYHLFNRYRECKTILAGRVLLTAALVSLMILLSEPGYANALVENFSYGIVFCMLLMSLYFYPSCVLVNPITIWLGKISFSIYLVHFAVVRFFNHFLYQSEFFAGDVGWLCGFLMVLLVSVPIAYLTYRLIEVPGIEYGRKLIENKLKIKNNFASLAR